MSMLRGCTYIAGALLCVGVGVFRPLLVLGLFLDLGVVHVIVQQRRCSFCHCSLMCMLRGTSLHQCWFRHSVSLCVERIKARRFRLVSLLHKCLHWDWHSVKTTQLVFIRAISQSYMAGFCGILHDLAHFSICHSSFTREHLAAALSSNLLRLGGVLCTVVYILCRSLLGTVAYRVRALHYARTLVF